jgi:hypothetical protein
MSLSITNNERYNYSFTLLCFCVILYHFIRKQIADFDAYYSIGLTNSYMQKLHLSIYFYNFFLIERNTVGWMNDLDTNYRICFE